MKSLETSLNFVNVNNLLTSDLNLEPPGYCIVENLLSPPAIKKLLSALALQQLKPGQGGIRRIDQLVRQVNKLAKSTEVISIVNRYLGKDPHLVRAIYFDKSEQNNWYVTWHQDKTITVSKQFQTNGWKPWSLKAGIWHVQPPLEVLEQMLTIRIHLDETNKNNGCLKVIPGSHRLGLIPTSEIAKHIQNKPIDYCEVAAGGAVIMKPHILHASEKTLAPKPRRVLHFEYSNYRLPDDIQWSS